MAIEETEEELEAALAVYGSDCTILKRSPPHLVLRLQPRTAYDISLQYPRKPPALEIKDTKGLDEMKVANLASGLEDLANELIFNPMLVAICEAALDRLTEMNQPDGNCSFCMEPLVLDAGKSDIRPFMKLLSCFHCFHSDCFGRWWRWVLQEKNLVFSSAFGSLEPEEEKDLSELIASCEKLLGEAELKCPICRKFINAEDLVSAWSALATDPALNQDREATVQEPDVMFSKNEAERKVRFDQLFRAQQCCGGIIEPRKLEVLVPGMFLPRRVLSYSELREEGDVPSSVIQASQSSTSLADVAAEAEPFFQQDTNCSRSISEQRVDAQIGLETGAVMESTRKLDGQCNDKRQRKGGRSSAGGRRGQWIRRGGEGNK